jgi:hypothetical protein
MTIKPKKQSINIWSHIDICNGFLLKCQLCIYNEEKKHEALLLGRQVHLQKNMQENTIMLFMTSVKLIFF